MNYRMKARHNGIDNEQYVIELLKKQMNDINHLNLLIDLKVNNKYFEIKSCQEYIEDKSFKNKKRHGRFFFYKEQHEFLVKNDGYYIFIVTLQNDKKLMKIVKAILVPKHKKNDKWCITWTKIF